MLFTFTLFPNDLEENSTKNIGNNEQNIARSASNHDLNAEKSEHSENDAFTISGHTDEKESSNIEIEDKGHYRINPSTDEKSNTGNFEV